MFHETVYKAILIVLNAHVDNNQFQFRLQFKTASVNPPKNSVYIFPPVMEIGNWNEEDVSTIHGEAKQ